MFLKKLYHYNKTLLCIVVVFFCSYIYLNYKWGMAASPIQLYGMYSGKCFIKDSVVVYAVIANNKLINNSSLSLIERDALQSYPEYYINEKSNNEKVFNTVSKYLNYLGINSQRNKYKFINNINDTLFTDWYRSKIEEMIKEPVITLQVYKQYFVWQYPQLQPIDKPVKLTYIGSY